MLWACRFVLGSFLGNAALVVTTSYVIHSFMPLFKDWQTQEGEKPGNWQNGVPCKNEGIAGFRRNMPACIAGTSFGR
jgi:hypothetical protein